MKIITLNKVQNDLLVRFEDGVYAIINSDKHNVRKSHDVSLILGEYVVNGVKKYSPFLALQNIAWASKFYGYDRHFMRRLAKEACKISLHKRAVAKIRHAVAISILGGCYD